MSNAPTQIWATGTIASGSWNAQPATMRNPPPETLYTRADAVMDDPRVRALLVAIRGARQALFEDDHSFAYRILDAELNKTEAP